MTFKEKIELLAKLAMEVETDNCIPQRMVDENEEFWAQLQNEILPAMLMADYKFRCDSAENSFGKGVV